MPAEPSPEQFVSAAELDHLARLFIEFEGAPDPRSTKCREAEAEFYSWIDRLYEEKVAAHYRSITRSQFRSFMRRKCRERAIKSIREFPCP